MVPVMFTSSIKKLFPPPEINSQRIWIGSWLPAKELRLTVWEIQSESALGENGEVEVFPPRQRLPINNAWKSPVLTTICANQNSQHICIGGSLSGKGDSKFQIKIGIISNIQRFGVQPVDLTIWSVVIIEYHRGAAEVTCGRGSVEIDIIIISKYAPIYTGHLGGFKVIHQLIAGGCVRLLYKNKSLNSRIGWSRAVGSS